MSTLIRRAFMIMTIMVLGGHGVPWAEDAVVPASTPPHQRAPAALAPKLAEGSAPGAPERPASPRLLNGELLKMTEDAYRIKDAEGKEFVVHIGVDTEFTGSFKPGDRIEVHLTPVVHAVDVMVTGNLLDERNALSALVEGEFVAIDGKYCVVKDPQGKEVRLHMSKETKFPENLKAGDTIQANVKTLDHAMFIKADKPGIK